MSVARLTVGTPNNFLIRCSVTVQQIKQILPNLTEAEFIELIPDISAVLRRTGTEYWWMKQHLFDAFEGEGFHITQAHFYSPQPTISELSSALWEGPRYETPAFVADIESMKTLFKELSVFASELADVPRTGMSGFYWDNAFFPNFDALIYYGLCRRFGPKVVLEVGSGFSTHIALRAAERNVATQVHCIEPYPTPTLTSVEGRLSQILVQRVQDVPLDVFGKLERNDILFVDTAHVSKIGGDLNHLLFKVLPCLPPGVLVHFHDIFLPYEYPYEWIAGRNWFWNEQYLLLAFLMYNQAFRTLFMNQRFLREHGAIVAESLGGLDLGPLQGASFWLCRERT